MSEYGLKIRNYQAGAIYEYNLGVRDLYDYADAMATNSLFLNFIKPYLTIWNEESTRDIISIDFKYGSRSYEEEISHLNKLIKSIDNNTELTQAEKDDMLSRYNYLIERSKTNKDLFDKKTAQELRHIFYKDGVVISYKEKNGGVVKIRYRMLYRTAGKAKKGSCIFINEKIYPIARDYLYMGIKLPKHNSPIVEMGVYSSLVTSTIVGTVKINPRNILIVDDVDSYFKTRVINVRTDENKHCIAETLDNYELKNTMFDGQALIDLSLFPDWGNGFILLRQHLCKMAAFATDIQGFFKDYFGSNYETAILKDRWGNEHYAKDIELITTENGIKWVKFDISYDYWCKKVEETGNVFGIVKTAHPSKLGTVQRMSYQMINALDLKLMPKICKPSLDYIKALKTDINTYLEFLNKNKNFSNDHEALLALVEQDPDFVNSAYFRERRKKIIAAYGLNFKSGKVLENADNLTIVGSPYAMLLHSVGEDVEKDDTLSPEEGCIQCYTERFDDGAYLAEFRSPMNSRNNIGHLHNKKDERIKKYFRLGRYCIAVNMRHTDFQDRN